MSAIALPLTDPAIYRHWWTDRIRFADTDQSQHVNNVAFVGYVETGRVYFCHHILGEAFGGAERFIVARITIDYRREMYWPGEVRVGAAVTRIGTKSFTVVNGVFKDDICAATAESVVVFLRDGKSALIEGVLRERLTAALVPGAT